MKLEKARQAAIDFLGKTLQKEGAIVKIEKTAEGWGVHAEVIEPSEFIKALGIPTVVRERNLYEIKLDQNLEVVSYERIGQAATRKTA